MPITPFIGVRISWLMLARKALLARLAASASSASSLARRAASSSSRLAASASSMARRSDSSISRRLVTSHVTPLRRTGVPSRPVRHPAALGDVGDAAVGVQRRGTRRRRARR